MTTTVLRVLFAASVLAVGACGVGDGDDTVVVFAAASLTDAFEELGEAYEATTGDVVELNVAGSSTLREQILDGAPADVFAAADEPTMATIVDAGLAADPTVFATNRPAIVTPAGNPAGVTSISAFADTDLLLGACAPQVPCGSLARELFDRAGVDPALDTEEADVRAVLTKVVAGELDAGIVYRSDVVAAGDAVIEIADEATDTAITRYPIVALTDDGAGFAAFVRSPAARDILRDHGFGLP